MDNSFKDVSFSIIKHLHVNRVTTIDGYICHRKDKLFVPEYNADVPCAPYDNHFIFLDPHVLKPGDPRKYWFAMCTCGGPSILVGSNAYSHLGSSSGMMFVCLVHLNTGKHVDGST
jgi:hypothetical protein